MASGTNAMIAFLSISNIISSALTIVSGLFVAKWILPEELGMFNGFTIITGYIVLIQLGIPSGLSRQLPLYLGMADRDKAYDYASTAQYWLKNLGLGVLGITMLLSSVLMVLGSSYRIAAGLLVIGLSVWQTLYITKYLKMLYRTNGDFNKLSWINLIIAVTSFLSLGFVYLYDFYGLCLRFFVVVVVDFSITFYWRPIKVKARFSKTPFQELIKVGLPMYGVANIYGLWPLVQRTLIVGIGGPKALGLFAVASMTENAMKTVSSSISSVMYPTMTSKWGTGHSVKDVLQLAAQPLMISVGLFAVLVPIGWHLLPIFVHYFLPNYVIGIEAAQWMLIVGFLGILLVLANIYNVLQKQRQRLIMYVSGIGIWIISVITISSLYGFKLKIFPISMIISYVVMIIIMAYHIKEFSKIKNC